MQKDPKVVLGLEIVCSVEPRARLGRSQVPNVGLCLFMTGQIALIMKSKIAGSASERIVRLILFSEVFGGFFMVLQGLFGAKCDIATLTVESLSCQSLFHAVCLMLSVPSWIVGSGFGHSFGCLIDVIVVVGLHLLVVVALSILSFQRKAFLLLLSGLGFELLSRKVKVAKDRFVQAAVRTKTVVFQCATVPGTDMTHAIISRACSHCAEHVSKCSLKSKEQKAIEGGFSSSWFWNPAEQAIVNNCVSFIQSLLNVLGKHKLSSYCFRRA